MNLDYAIRTLENHRNKLEDKLEEIKNGEYNHHPRLQIENFKKQTIENIQSISAAIDVLKENLK